MKLIGEARRLFGGSSVWKTNEWILGLASFLSSCFCVSVIPFLRMDMGENYFGWLNLWFGYSVIAGFTFFGSLLTFFIHDPILWPQLTTYFWMAFIVASLYQKQRIASRNNSGREWHSMYIGTSLLEAPLARFGVSREMIFKFIEPGLVFLVGHFLWVLNWEIGLWLTLAAFSLAINNHIVFYHERQNIIVLRDAQIEARYMSDAIAGKPAEETGGFVVADSTRKLVGQDTTLNAAFSNLSKEVKDMLDTSEEGAS